MFFTSTKYVLLNLQKLHCINALKQEDVRNNYYDIFYKR